MNLKLVKKIILVICIFSFRFSSAEEVTSIPQIGTHQKIFIVKKSLNPQNKLVVFTRLDLHCKFIIDDTTKAPLFDFYWMMDGSTYKPMNPILKTAVRKQLELHTDQNASEYEVFYVTLNDLNTLDHDIPDPRLKVSNTVRNGICDTEPTMRLGPSDKNVLVQVESFYGESVGTIRPKVISATIKGKILDTGAPITRTYKLKN